MKSVRRSLSEIERRPDFSTRACPKARTASHRSVAVCAFGASYAGQPRLTRLRANAAPRYTLASIGQRGASAFDPFTDYRARMGRRGRRWAAGGGCLSTCGDSASMQAPRGADDVRIVIAGRRDPNRRKDDMPR